VAAAGLCEGGVPVGTVGGVRGARLAGPGQLGALRRVHLYFETNQRDEFREPGFSKKRRLEPQITIGLLTGQDGFPLMVSAFEGNWAESPCGPRRMAPNRVRLACQR
jgi:hypothetical protein